MGNLYRILRDHPTESRKPFLNALVSPEKNDYRVPIGGRYLNGTSIRDSTLNHKDRRGKKYLVRHSIDRLGGINH